MNFDTVEKIAPIYWRNSQLSIARHYGGIKINGRYFYLDPESDFLIREDIWKKELTDEKRKEAEKKKWLKSQQGSLL